MKRFGGKRLPDAVMRNYGIVLALTMAAARQILTDGESTSKAHLCMIERRENFGFSLEALETKCARSQGSMEFLHRALDCVEGVL